MNARARPPPLLSVSVCFLFPSRSQKAFITLGSPVVPLLSTSKADSGLASEFRWDQAGYTAYERMLKEEAEHEAQAGGSGGHTHKRSRSKEHAGRKGGGPGASAGWRVKRGKNNAFVLRWNSHGVSRMRGVFDSSLMQVSILPCTYLVST